MSPARAARHLALGLVVTVLLGACGGAQTSPPPATATAPATPGLTASPFASASPASTAPVPTSASSPASAPSLVPTSSSPAPGAVTGGVVVTFRAADGSTWRTRLVRAADIAIARDLLAGRPGPAIPNGRIVRGDPDVNTGWSWHLDPADFAWADMTTEVCDGNPGSVEDGTLTSDRYCPWTAKVTAVDPAP